MVLELNVSHSASAGRSGFPSAIADHADELQEQALTNSWSL